MQNESIEILKITIIKIINENKIYEINKIKGTINYFNGYLKFNILNSKPNLEYYKINQIVNNKKFVNQVDLKFYIDKLKETNKFKQKSNYNLLTYQSIINNINYEYSLFKNGTNKFNINVKDDEYIIFIFNNIEFNKKNIIIKNIIEKNHTKQELLLTEKILKSYIFKNYVIYYKDIAFTKYTKKRIKSSKSLKKSSKSLKKSLIKNEIYGYYNCTNKQLLIYYFDPTKKDNDKFTINNLYYNNILFKKINNLKKEVINNLYGYYNVENNNVYFKIMDLTLSDKKSQKGSKCIDKQKNQILKYCKVLKEDNYKQKKKILCNDLQILFFFRKNQNDTKKMVF